MDMGDIPTLEQYETALRAQAIADYGALGVTVEEYDASYPPRSRLQEWYDTIIDAARNGQSIPASVLDNVATSAGAYQLGWLMRAYPNSIPGDYLPPHARAAEA